ncbi:MAG: ABC transporter substrate-binding protein, partial [Chloroflexi bacterium]|nr:ABC transporter substrate-binding protein [Chloroflexota bacterium]
PATQTTLKPRVENDEVVLFAMAASREAYLPPGYVFNLGVEAQYEAYTLLKWIAENDWDYEAKGPAKVGGAAWSESYSDVLLVAMEKYCSTHPDQFVWEGGYLTAFSMNWQAEVEALKDCDYVYPGILFISFVEQYREAGYTEAKFLGSDTSAAFMGSVDSAERWDEIDGMFFLRASHWWNEEGEIVNLVKQLVHKNHSSETERIVSSGVGYMAINQLHAMFSIIADAVEAVGPENFNSQALYNAAESFSMTINGIPRFSFGEDKRWMTDIYGIYEARGAEKDIFRVNDEWYPVVCNP